MANPRSLWDYRSYLIIFLTPLLLLPLPIILNTLEAKCAFVVILMAVYWCTQCVPLAVTALLPAIFFPMMGIMKSEQVCLQYFSDATMLGVGGLSVAIAVEYWNLHKRLALSIILLVGLRPALLMAGFMTVTAFLSMFISNIGCVAMMLPIVHDVLENCSKTGAACKELEQHSVVTDAVHMRATKQGIQFTESSAEEVSRSEQKKLRLQQKYMNLTKGMSLSVCYAGSIGSTATLTGAIPNLFLKAQIDKLFPENGDVLNYTSWFKFSFFNMVLMLITSYLWLLYMFLGFNVKKMFGCRKTSKHKREAYQLMRSEYKKLGSFSFAEGCILVLFVLLVVLWFTRDPSFMPGWASLLFNQERKFVTDTTVSVFITIMFFIIPSKIPQIFCCNTGSFNLTGRARVRAPQTLLPWGVLQKKIPWNVMLLLGGALALAKGTEISGLSMTIAQALEPLKNIPPVALLFLLCLLVAMLTEICSNTVISTMLLPVLAPMASTTGLHPLYLMIPPTISASFSFMLPVATPTNALTFTYTHMKVIDMVKPGFMLNLIGILCINLAINTWGTAMFQLNEFPTWANVNTSTTASPLPSGLPTIKL